MKEVLNYVCEKKLFEKGDIAFAVFGLCCMVGIPLFFMSLMDGEVSLELLRNLLLSLLGIGILAKSFADFQKKRKNLFYRQNLVRRDLDEEQCAVDFRSAEKLVDDSFRVGKNYIFPKHKDRIIRIEDVRRIYTEPVVVYDVCLKALLSNGEEPILCAYPVKMVKGNNCRLFYNDLIRHLGERFPQIEAEIYDEQANAGKEISWEDVKKKLH